MKVPKSISFRACIYSSKEEGGAFVAHCLELDVVGVSATVEGSLDELLEGIETQLDTCTEFNTQLLFPAPPIVWQKYNQAKKAGRKLSSELLDRVIRNANRRLGYITDNRFDYIVGTREVPRECLAYA